MTPKQKRKLIYILTKAKAMNLDSHEQRLFLAFLKEKLK